ncbi:beta-phosphoglucomutase [Thermosediminibacter litoriperuensis]|uniref:Beta-phosphoglucomutase n=1 Tax=Thermosediminibacter litoriperuensis TaxID=291989 RepID=A0A5S5AKE4_9FIRM|nr:beta-phosphoglucomutase [Thermosediminibacter litoriperuensis]TYP51319.1 beta-phosphoglucomutase [Thermosediminibacter litoriperuensis]
MPVYKAAVFDLDGVITDTARFHYLAWKKLADELGVYFDENINERLKGVGRMESLEIILEKSPRRFSRDEKEYLAEKKNGYYKNMIEKITQKDLLPGVKELFFALKGRGVKIALASASRNAPTVLKNLGIAELFDYVVDAGRIKRCKPDPEIFLVAAENLGLKPGECVGIEDSAAGIEAIKRAGMFAVGIGDPEILKNADMVLRDLKNLRAILKLFDD